MKAGEGSADFARAAHARRTPIYGNAFTGLHTSSNALRRAQERQENPMNRVQNFLGDESGVTAIEYALIASLIAVFIVAALQVVGTNLSTVFNEIGATLK